MKVISIDPSLRHTGYSILEQKYYSQNKVKLQPITYGVINNKNSLKQSLCLINIKEKINDLIEEFSPEICAIESIIFVQNFKTAITMGASRAASMIACAENGLEIFEYPPKRIKQSVVGRGAATKQQVAFMVRSMLGIRENIPDDASDALAIGITYFNEKKLLSVSSEIKKNISI